ncbi:MAG: ATP-binding protein [Phycisphaerae bacterium]
MKLSIRSKLVALLTLVGLLPLTGALIVVVKFGGSLRRESFGQMVLTVASAETAELRWILINDIENMELSLRESPHVQELTDPNRQLDPMELDRIERQWPRLSNSDPIVAQIVTHPITSVLERLQTHDPKLVEILVTDRWGQLVAATQKTSDFYHAGEQWWQDAWYEGRGRICVPPITYHESVGVWGLELVIPIQRDGQLVGIAKAVMELEEWICTPHNRIKELDAKSMLIREDGKIVYREGSEPLGEELAGWQGLSRTRGTWRVTDGEIQAFAPFQMPDQIGEYPMCWQGWLLGLYMPQSQALGPLYRLGAVVTAIGLTTILAIFAVGLWLVERSIVRRLRILTHATREVSQGDFSKRVEGNWAGGRLLGQDEIDELASDFNRMVQTVESSHQQLQSANELKEDFIKIAGHELRTPVTYILATAKLLADSRDVDRLKKALETISFKTRRLNKIIQAMFKLMPGPEGIEEMLYEEVDLPSLLEEVFLDSQQFVERRDQKLIVEFVDDLPPVTADRDKLFDIVSNLVMNAIKFTPNAGTVRVFLGRELGDYVSVTVRDEGPGVPPDEMPHIFKPFFSGRDVMKHSTGWSGYQKRGIGLGLAVVKHFVDLHHGTVRVSNTGKGAEFVVTIPIDPTVIEGAG